MRRSIIFIAILTIFFAGCSNRQNQGQVLHIIHAGSLSYPVKELVAAYRQKNPGVEILTEAWGSKAGARKVMEVQTQADIFLSADYMVIENMLIPEHASWYIPFASNEMAVVYTEKSRYSDEINQDNWFEIMLRPDVNIGRSNPDHDPCGVRSVFTCQLAGIYYDQAEITEKLLSKDPENVRPKETDLIALLENGHLDYIFLYKSVARQHHLKHLDLPAELSLGEASLNKWYQQAKIETVGKKPGETITETGQAMVYGLTIPNKTTNKELAESFVSFVLSDEGVAILESLGQPPVKNVENPYYSAIPESLKDFSDPVGIE